MGGSAEAGGLADWGRFFIIGCCDYCMWRIDGLEVYGKIKELVVRVYGLIKGLPVEERYALADQMRRAVVGVRIKMEEGSRKRTSKDFVSYLDASMGSLREVRGCIETGIDLGYFGEEGKKEVEEIKRIAQ